MSCLCAANTLRLFVRSLVQVDIPASVIHASKHSKNTSFGRHSPVRATRELHSTPARLDSARITPSDDSILSENVSTGTPQPSDRSRRDGGSSIQKNAESAKGAVTELSVQSIDELLAELNSKTNPYTAPQTESFAPKPKPIGKGGLPRRVKVPSPPLAVRYSSPRVAEPAAEAPKADKTSKSSNGKDSTETQKKDDWTPPPREPWQIYKKALEQKFPEGWNPRKRLSPDALAGIRALHAQMPQVYTTSALAASFEVSPEAIRRILKSKWSPDAEEETDRQRRWFNRGKQIYTKHAAMGGKPPKKWRQLGIGDGKPEWMKRKQAQRQARGPLPALITTKRAPRPVGGNPEDSLADRIL